jgi:hypothetical protein
MAARALAVGAWALCVAWSMSAAADPSGAELAAARDSFAKAERDEDAGRWDVALEEVRRAASVKMTPGLRFHTALCEEKLGQLVAALADYAAAEAQAREEGNRDVLGAVADPLADLRARVPTLTIVMPKGLKDASLTLDGTPLAGGSSATPIRLDPGKHSVEGMAPGRKPFSQTVTLAERDAKTLEMALPELSVAAPATPVTEPPPAPPPPRVSRVGAIVASAGAVVLAGAGVASFFVAGAKQSSAETECKQLVSCSDLKGPVRTFDWLALSAWSGAAVAGTVAVVLWVRSPKVDSAALLFVGPGSVAVRASF